MNDYERLGKILWVLAAVAVISALFQLLGIARGPAVLVGTVCLVALIGLSVYRSRMHKRL
jgi:hypothetical protein